MLLIQSRRSLLLNANQKEEALLNVKLPLTRNRIRRGQF